MNKKGINAVLLTLILSGIAVAFIFIGILQSYKLLACYMGVNWEQVANPTEVYVGQQFMTLNYSRFDITYETCAKTCPPICEEVTCLDYCECIPSPIYCKEDYESYIACEKATCNTNCTDNPAVWCPADCDDASDAVKACKNYVRENSNCNDWESKNACPGTCDKDTLASYTDDNDAIRSCIANRESEAFELCKSVTCENCMTEMAPLYCYNNFDFNEENVMIEECNKNPDSDEPYNRCIDFYNSSKNAEICLARCSSFRGYEHSYWSFEVTYYGLTPSRIMIRAYSHDNVTNVDRLVFSKVSEDQLSFGDVFDAFYIAKKKEECRMNLTVEVYALDNNVIEKKVEKLGEYPFCVGKIPKDINITLHEILFSASTIQAKYSITGSDVVDMCPNGTIIVRGQSCDGTVEYPLAIFDIDSARSDWYEYANAGIRVPLTLTNDIGVDISKPEFAVVNLSFSEIGYELHDCEDILITTADGTLLPVYINSKDESGGKCNWAEIWFALSTIDPDPDNSQTWFKNGDIWHFYAYIGNGIAENVKNNWEDIQDCSNAECSNIFLDNPSEYLSEYKVPLDSGEYYHTLYEETDKEKWIRLKKVEEG